MMFMYFCRSPSRYPDFWGVIEIRAFPDTQLGRIAASVPGEKTVSNVVDAAASSIKDRERKMCKHVLMFPINRGVPSLFSDIQPCIDIVEGFLAVGNELVSQVPIGWRHSGTRDLLDP